MITDVDTYQHLTRQLDLIPVGTLKMPVTIIGCGAIGSFLGLQLAKMGLTNLTFFDHDTVSIENMSNQFFMAKQIDKNKAQALSELIFEFTGFHGTPFMPRKFEAQDASKLLGLVVVAVDSMEARRMIYESIKEYGFNVKYIIDPRMSAEFFTQYTINPFNPDDNVMYEKTLFDDKDGVQERCTAKSTVYTASLAAGIVTKTVKDILLKGTYPRTTHWDISSCQNPMVMFPSK